MSDNLELPFRPTDRSLLAGAINLIEAPIWRLDPRAVRPEVSPGIIRKSDYATEVTWRRNTKTGEVITYKVIIRAHQDYGYPTMLSCRIMLALVQEAGRRQYASRRLDVTMAHLCRWLEMPASGKAYKLIADALLALEGADFEFHSSWFEMKKGSRVGSIFPGLRTVKLVDKIALAPVSRHRSSAQEEDLGLSASFIDLGEELFEHIKNGGAIPADLSYMNKLGTPVSQRFYTYMEKRSYGKDSYHERLVKLAERMPLEKRAPSAIRTSLEPACKRLMTRGPDGKRLLSGYKFFEPGDLDPLGRVVREHTLWVWFERGPGAGAVARLKARRDAAAQGLPLPDLFETDVGGDSDGGGEGDEE